MLSPQLRIHEIKKERYREAAAIVIRKQKKQKTKKNKNE